MHERARLRFDDLGAFGARPPGDLRQADPPARVAVIFGGPSPEHDVSILTGLQAAHALDGAPGIAGLRSLYWSKSGHWYEVRPSIEAVDFLEGVPSNSVRLRFVSGPEGGFVRSVGGLRPREERLELDVALICCHGGPGEDGTLQGALDLTSTAYSGPSAIGAALGMDKLAFGALMTYAGLPALERVPLDAHSDEPRFAPPYIVKPRFGGSSIGVEVVADFETAMARLGANPHLRGGAVLEPYRDDLFDLQLAARSWPALELSAIERPLRTRSDGEILGYQDKYVGAEGMTTAPREMPARIDPKLEDRMRALAREVAVLVGLRGVARLDFLSDGQEVFVNEINTIPGSLSHYLWVEPRLGLRQLVMDLLSEAQARPAAAYSSVGSDGSVLRVAGSIASKLG